MAVWEVNFTVKDGNASSKRNTASSKFNLGAALSVEDATAEAQGIIERIDACSDGKVVDVGLMFKPDISAWNIKANPSADANRWEKAMFIWNVGSQFFTRFTIPARKKSIVVPNSEVIDTTTAGAPGTLLKSDFLAATTVDEHGGAVTALSSAKEAPG